MKIYGEPKRIVHILFNLPGCFSDLCWFCLPRRVLWSASSPRAHHLYYQPFRGWGHLGCDCMEPQLPLGQQEHHLTNPDMWPAVAEKFCAALYGFNCSNMCGSDLLWWWLFEHSWCWFFTASSVEHVRVSKVLKVAISRREPSSWEISCAIVMELSLLEILMWVNVQLRGAAREFES